MSVPEKPVFYDEFGTVALTNSYVYPVQTAPEFSREIFAHYRKEKLRLLTE